MRAGDRVDFLRSMGNRMLARKGIAIVLSVLLLAAYTVVYADSGRGPTRDDILQKLVERLCERQAAIGHRIGVPFISPELCGTQPPPQQPTLTFTATPSTIQSGDMSNLAWNSTNATSCTASNGWSGAKNTSGNTNVSPTVNTTYTLMCSGAGGNVTKSATITVTPVTPPQTATLTLQKTVVNDNGGQKSAADFQAKIDGGNVAWNSGQTVSVGSHTASEITLAGYTAGSWGGDCAANGTITFAAGDNKTCTITNDDQAATLIVKKVVIRDNGGSAATSTFSFKVNDGNAIAFEADGQNDLIVNAGTYTITETPLSGWDLESIVCAETVDIGMIMSGFILTSFSAICTAMLILP